MTEAAHKQPNYIGVFWWLLVLTIIEIAVIYLPIAKFAIAVMLIVLAVTKAALVALSAYEDDQIGERVTGLLPELKGQAQLAAFTLLASRPSWSRRLLDAVQAGRISPAAVPEDVANRLRRSRDRRRRMSRGHGP